MFRILQLRTAYYFGKACAFLGFCWRCRCGVNHTRYGAAICPHCRHRY